MRADPAVSVLAVIPDEDDHVALGHVFSHSNWELHRVQSCEEARSFLATTRIGVVICEATLADGLWHDLLQSAASNPAPPRLIVAAHGADDRLWAEVLNRGGYDVLSKPFDAREVVRVVSLAWRQWKHDVEAAGSAQTHSAGQTPEDRTED